MRLRWPASSPGFLYRVSRAGRRLRSLALIAGAGITCWVGIYYIYFVHPIPPAMAFYLDNPHAGYWDKMGGFYPPVVLDYLQFVKTHTPEDSVILLPPYRLPWVFLGHATFVQYFLLPRYVVRGKGITVQDAIEQERITHILICPGSERYDPELSAQSLPGLLAQKGDAGWPEAPLPDGRTIIMDQRISIQIRSLELIAGKESLNILQGKMLEKGEHNIRGDNVVHFRDRGIDNIVLTYHGQDAPGNGCFDYWGKRVESYLSGPWKLSGKVLSNVPGSLRLFCRIKPPGGESELLQSEPNSLGNTEQVLTIDSPGGAARGTLLETAGVNIQFPADWKLFELERD